MTIATDYRSTSPRLEHPPASGVEFDVPLPDDVQGTLASVSKSALTPVLIVAAGESRRVAARALHELSHPSDPKAPFIEVDCTIFANDALGAELFGREHDGNGRQAAGGSQIDLATGGTLFLDHLTSLSAGAQARLVRLLDALTQKGTTRNGDSTTLRIVAGCEREPLGAVEAGRLRDDLYRELAVFRVDIPPLRARGGAVLELARGYVRLFAERLGKAVKGLSADAENALLAYDFPGNERELRGVIERAVILTQSSELTPGDLGLDDMRNRQVSPEDHFFWVDANPGGVPPPLDVVDRAYVARVLTHTAGRRLAAAHLLGISYPTFLKRLRELGFDRPAAGATSR
jgi:two-component system response regulator AtoC